MNTITIHEHLDGQIEITYWDQVRENTRQKLTLLLDDNYMQYVIEWSYKEVELWAKYVLDNPWLFNYPTIFYTYETTKWEKWITIDMQLIPAWSSYIKHIRPFSDIEDMMENL